jgi:hypothetical protein
MSRIIGQQIKLPVTRRKSVAAARVGSHLQYRLKQLGIPACLDCSDMLRRLNHLGPAGCGEQREEILAELSSRALKIWDKLSWTQRARLITRWEAAGSAKLAAAGQALWDLPGTLRRVLDNFLAESIAAAAQGLPLPLMHASATIPLDGDDAENATLCGCCCSCIYCSGHVPGCYEVTVSGVVDRDCSECEQVNGTWRVYCRPTGCSWIGAPEDALPICGSSGRSILFSLGATFWQAHMWGDGSMATYTLEPITTPTECNAPITVNYDMSFYGDCDDWPMTLTFTPCT